MLTYFLQVNVCWLLFYGVYYALLSKETFFRLNRLWLIASLLCGLALPFAADYFAVKVVPTHLFVTTLEPFVVSATALQRNLVADTEGVVLKGLTLVYVLGATVLAARFLAGLFLISKLLIQSKREKKDDFTLVLTEGGIPPFSFFKMIFINPNEFESYDFQQIMQHEKAHVRQRHSFDVVFLEILNIVFWCSPLIYFYKTSLRNVHEYLADEAVLRQNAKSQYGRLLLRQRQSGVALSLTSNISNHFFSQLKKRILMMTRNKSKRTALIKYALAAPIFLILTAALASPKTPILAKTEVLGDKVVATVEDFEKEKLSILNDTVSQIIRDTTPPLIQSKLPIKEGEHFVFLGDFRNDRTITVEELAKVNKLEVVLKHLDKLWEGEITSYILVIIPKRSDPYQTYVAGSMSGEATKLLKMAKVGDMIQFFNIKGRWVGDATSRDLGSLSLMVVDSKLSFKPLSDLKLVDEKQIAQMNIDSKEDFNTQITITFKDGHVERYKGTKAEFEQVFKKEGSNMQSNKLTEMVVVGRSAQKNSSQPIGQNVTEQKIEQPNAKTEVEKSGNAPVFTIVEQQPEFVGGMQALFKWLGENIKYPKSARDAGAQGTVYVGFVIETDGSITNVAVKRDVPVIIRDTITITEVNGIKGNKIVERTEYSLGKEAIRVISMMPNWKPGKQQGKPVRVAYTLPIKFKLE